MTHPEGDLQEQIDAIVARMCANRSDIDGLIERADASDRRASSASRRADDLESRSRVDRELIAELQADGVVQAANVAELEAALVSSRIIGAAIGILMASRDITQHEALTVLKETSQRTNTKMRVLAERLLADTGASAGARPTR